MGPIYPHILAKPQKILYAGSVRLKNGVGYLVDVAECLQNDGIDIVIAGQGTELAALIDNASARGIDNVHFVGEIDKSLIPSFLKQGDLLFFHAQAQTEISRYGLSPNKLFDYMASGKAIISDLPSNYSLIEKHQCGVDRLFSSASECAECIKSMLASPDALMRWGENARKTAQLYSFEQLSQKLMDLIYDLGESKHAK